MSAFTLLFTILFSSWICHGADVLFISTLTGAELSIAQDMSLKADILSPSHWAIKPTSYFRSYKAIIIGDPDSDDLSMLDPLVSSRKKWSPAITGNIIIIG